jgi:phage shock protein PspC (stress-responsive transcriptional regulator)
MINFIRNFFERKVFGVSSWWGNRLGIKASFIRLFFIYAAFTSAITVIIYLSMVFILKVRNHFKFRKRKSVFDL